MATNESYLDLMMSRLGRRTNPTIRTALVDEIEAARLQLENGKFLPWFLEVKAALPMIVDQNYIALPSDFIREIEDREAFAYDPDDASEDKVFKIRDEDRYRLSTSTEGTAKPARYSITGSRFYFLPTPDKAYEFRVDYWGHSTEFTDTAASLNVWLSYSPDVLLGLAGAKVARLHLQNSPLAQEFKEMHKVAWMELFVQHEARLHTNIDYSNDELII